MNVAAPIAVTRRRNAILARGDALQAQLCRPVPAALAIAAALCVAMLVIHLAGGTQLPWVHLLYIPILIGAMAFGMAGGIATAMLAGLVAVGPLMPLDVATGEAQATVAWVSRLLFFMLFGAIAGSLFRSLSKLNGSLQRAAYRNLLTGLPNRLQLLSDLQAAARNGAEPPATLLVAEQCRYQDIRDIFGVRYSDALLLAAAQRLAKALPSGVQLYHLRDGRFAALLAKSDFATTFADITALPDSLEGPVDVEGIAVDTDIRVGVVRFDDDFSDVPELLRRGSAAVRKANQGSSRIAIYDAAEDIDNRRAWDLLTDMKRVLDDGTGLELHYQPQVSLADGSCRSAEALVRWNHATKGFIPPAEFIPALEKTSLIVPFTDWVIDTALRSLAEHATASDDFVISINVSVRNLEERDFVGNLRARLAFYGVAPERLEIEVTESAVIREPATTRAALAAIRDTGVRVALDDYGTGYSSLSYLYEMPLTTLKLDRKFIVALLENPKSAIIAQSTIDVAHQLGLTVVAEGVEDAVTAAQLQKMGCDVGQGWLWSKALPPAEFRAWLSGRSARPADGTSAPIAAQRSTGG